MNRRARLPDATLEVGNPDDARGGSGRTVGDALEVLAKLLDFSEGEQALSPADRPLGEFLRLDGVFDRLAGDAEKVRQFCEAERPGCLFHVGRERPSPGQLHQSLGGFRHLLQFRGPA